MLHPEYVTGFCDGEASFSITLSPRKDTWEVRPSFSVSQNKNSRGILYQLREFFNCGYVRPSKRDNTYKYEVRKVGDLAQKIIPHFDKYPLRTEKQRNFKGLKKVVHLMEKGEHLNPAGLKKILGLMEEINPQSKKVYNRKTIQKLVKV